ncbi:MAG: uncharacterized protein JWQ45_1426 [Blastococcus sp.]|jgi:heat shock protein HslJ|nr:uncharacterized protein [Blastococcus sp.]
MAGPGRRCAFLVLIVVLAACADPAGSREPAIPATHLFGEWELVEGLSGDTQLPQPAGRRATITVDADHVGGTSFCNNYGSSYRVSGSRFILHGLGGTDMACEPDVMTAETAYLRALAAVEDATVEDEELRLTGGGTLLRYQRVPAVPVSDVVGTRWVLETLVDGEIAGSVAGEPAVLVLARDGGLSGSTGCRAFSGRWAGTGDALAFSELHAEGACPADVRSQDEQVLAVLDGGATTSVDADRLTLTRSDGLGLVYRGS